MTTRRLAVPALAAALACAVPATAHAATLAVNKPCYGTGDLVILAGTGYTPGGQVQVGTAGKVAAVTAFGPTTKAPGAILANTFVPFTSVAKRLDTFTATDVTNPALTASTVVRSTVVKVKISPRRASPYAVRRVKAAGFTAGKTLYRHVVRGKSVSTARQGRLKGGCHTGSYRLRLFRRNAPSGTYRVQFDTSRRYRRSTLQKVVFRLKVSRTVIRSSSAAAASVGTATAASMSLIR